MPDIRPSDRMRTQRIPLLFNGVSQQAPTARLPSQVADAENAAFSVVDGMTRRAPSWIQQWLPPGLLPAGNNRLHAIVRDQTERYIVVHNRTATGGFVRALELSSNLWATVEISTVAQVYLNQGSPDAFRFRTLVDYTIIVNTDVALGTTGSSGTISGTTSSLLGSGAITSYTAANPTVITSAAHTLVTGNLIFIQGSYGGSPLINGLWSVTRIDADTFSIPVSVVVGGVGGLWTKVAISVANPTVVTSAAHGLSNGDGIVIAGSNSTPTIDGERVVSGVTTNTFTVPVTVTSPGTVGTWSILRLDASKMPMQMTRENTGGTTRTGTANATSGAPLTSTVLATQTHLLVTGQTIIVTASGTNPTILGQEFVVTVTNSTTFTIPVPGGIIGPGTISWTSRAYFKIGVIAWNSRASGDNTTNPVPDLWLNARKLTDVRFWRGRLWLFSGTRLTSSQAEDLFNFWIEDVNAVSDSDPIDVPLSSERVADIDYAVPIQDALFLLTKAGRQFVVTGGSAGLTTTSIQAKPVTGYTTLAVEPIILDPAVYYCSKSGTAVQLLEYLFDEVAVPSAADDVSSHVPKFIPLNVPVPADIGTGLTAEASIVKRLDASAEHGMVFLLRRDRVITGETFSRFIYVYRTRYLGQQKAQSAWTRWKVAGVRGIHDLVVVGPYLYFLAHNLSDGPPPTLNFYIGRISIIAETDADSIPSPSI